MAKADNVTVNGKKIQKYQWGSSSFYKVVATDTSQSIDDYDVLDFSKDLFTNEATIVVKADGYQDLTFKVKDGVLVLE